MSFIHSGAEKKLTISLFGGEGGSMLISGGHKTAAKSTTGATLNMVYDGEKVAVAARGAVGEGTKVFRVWGDEAGAFGRSWTTVDPRTVPGYRNAAGLPNQNTGRFLSEGVIQDTTGIKFKAADPLHGNAGGLPGVVIPNPAQQIKLQNVQGLNPQF